MKRFAVTVCVLVWATEAQASPLFELVGDVSGDGGLAARNGGAGAASTYFNPALLPHAAPRLELGLFLLADRITIDPAARPDDSSLVAVDAAGAFETEPDLAPVFPPPIPTDWLEEGCEGSCTPLHEPVTARARQGDDSSDNLRSYLAVGLVNQLWEDKLVFGLHLLASLSEFTTTRSYYNDERAQYFSNSLHPELYSDRLTAMSVAFGFGSRPVDALSLGVSFTMNLDNSAAAATFVPDASRYEELLLSNDVSVESTLAPHFGIAVDPTDDLQLTATFHTAQSLTIEAEFSSFLPDGSEQFAVRRFTHDYQPWSMGFGGNYRMDVSSWHRWTLLAGGTLAGWSDYRDRHDAQPTGDFEWSNTLTPTLGVRHEYGRTSNLLDLTYVTSPAPEQTGRRNYVDNDRLGFSGAVHYEFGLGAMTLRAGLHAQLHLLLERTHEKREGGSDPVRDEVPDDAVARDTVTEVDPRDGLQTNNPGYPGFSSSGVLIGGGANLAVVF